MKKGLRLIPLTAAFVLAVSGIGSAASTPDTVYYKNADKEWQMTDDYEASKAAIQEAQVNDREIIVVDVDNATIDWAAAIRANKDYWGLEHDSSVTIPDMDTDEPGEPGDDNGDLDETTATVKISEDGVSIVSGGLDVVDADKSEIQSLLPGDNQVLVILKEGTTDDYTAKYDGKDMTPRKDKTGFYIGIGPETDAKVTLTNEDGTQTVTITQ